MSPSPRVWTHEAALAAVHGFVDRHGYQPVSDEAGLQHGLPSWSAAKRLFGGWNEMMRAGGYTPYPARASGPAKVRAFRDRNPHWRETLTKAAQASRVA